MRPQMRTSRLTRAIPSGSFQRNARRFGLRGDDRRSGPTRPGQPGSPPARFAISIATCHASARLRGENAVAALALVIVAAGSVEPMHSRLEADDAAKTGRPQYRADHLCAEPGN